jgi:hypothetical protein
VAFVKKRKKNRKEVEQRQNRTATKSRPKIESEYVMYNWPNFSSNKQVILLLLMLLLFTTENEIKKKNQRLKKMLDSSYLAIVMKFGLQNVFSFFPIYTVHPKK